MQKLFKGLDWIENALAAFGGILVVGATFSVVLEVFSRYFFHHSFIWVNETVEYVLLYVPFLGAGWLLRKNAHITIDVLEPYMPKSVKRAADAFIVLLGVFVSAVLLWYGAKLTWDYWESDLRSLTPLKIPLYCVIVSIPLGSSVLLLEFVRRGYRLAKGEGEWTGG